MELARVSEIWQATTGSLTRMYRGSRRPGRSRGRTDRLRRFGPHTAMIRQRLTDLESLRQAALSRELRQARSGTSHPVT
jgi:hypothetical protein